MSAVPHTPAPWLASQGMEDDLTRWVIVAGGGGPRYHLATIANGQPGDCLETEGATARLMAAAPELLEALQFLLAASECADETGYVEDHGFVNLEELQARARAAIAKAEGGGQ